MNHINNKYQNNLSLVKSSQRLRIISSLILAGSISVSTLAQNVYTLDQCLNEAVSNNMKLRNADNQIAMSEEQRKEAYTKYFSTISAVGGGFMANKGLIEMDLAPGQGMSLAKNGVTVGVTAMQPIFAGGQIVNANKLAKVSTEANKLQKSLTENEIRLNTEQYYWQIVQLKEKLVTLDQLDKQLERVRKDAQAAVDAGVRNRNDVLQVQLRQNEVKTQRIQVQNAVSTMKDLLAQVMGHPNESIDVNYPIIGETYKQPESPQQFFQSPQSSLYQTHEYQLLDKQIEANKLQYKLSIGKNLPSVAVGGGYMYNDIMDKSQSRLIGMFTVSIPISNWWGGSHDMKRQKIQIVNALNDKQDKSELLIVKMRKAWNDMNDAYKQVAIAKESITQSEENLRLNTDYYQAGTATISDLLDAQTLFQQSRDKYVESFTNYEVKKREYLQATGR